MGTWKEDVAAAAGMIPDAAALKGRRVLVAGATGLIGRAFTAVLEQAGAEAVRTTRSRGAKDVYFDAMDAEGVPDVRAGYIVNLAGNADPASIAADPAGTLLMSVNGTRRLLEAARRCGARFLYVSSSEIYGRPVGKGPWRENDRGLVEPLSPRASYAAGKRAAEALCAGSFAGYGADVVIARPGHVYGPTAPQRDSHVAAQLLRSAARGEDLVLKSAGTQMRSWVHCLDCAAALATLLTRGKAGEAYNVAHPQGAMSIRGFAHAVARAAGVRLLFDDATAAEKRAFNPMDDLRLNADKLVSLGWQGLYGVEDGVAECLGVMRQGGPD